MTDLGPERIDQNLTVKVVNHNNAGPIDNIEALIRKLPGSKVVHH
jgi:hypothetical protein